MLYSDIDYAAQERRESQMIDDGLRRALDRDKRAAERGEQTRAETVTLAHLLPPCSAWLETLVGSYTTGSRPQWWSTLKLLDLDEVAAAAIRAGFNCALKQRDRTASLRQFGKALEMLVAFSGLMAKAEKKAAKDRVRALVKARATPTARMRAIGRAAEAQLGHEAWDDETLLHMGAPLASAALSTGLFVEEETTRRGDTVIRFVLSAEGAALVTEVEDLGMLAQPIFRPMVVPPTPWTSPRDGAYLTEGMKGQVKLVRTRNREQAKLLNAASKAGELAPLLKVVSDIQSVPLRINAAVLALREWAWANRVDIGEGFPRRDPVAVPEVPEGIELQPMPMQRRFWASRARAQRVNAGIGPNLIGFAATSAEARDLSTKPGFFLPHFLDFRGRVYPVPAFNHHAGDATKALIEFANAAPLGPYGLDWLKVQVANTGDFDKISKKPFEARVEWVDENLDDLIQATADNPQGDLRWTKADAPFGFYAACVDLAAALRSPHPYTYESRLPVALDGSNSGVQHYAAMTRAEEGRYVNLTPSEAPQDLYGVVAAQVQRTAQRTLAGVSTALSVAPTRDCLIDALDANAEAIAAIEGPSKADGVRLSKSETARVAKLKVRRGTICACLWALEGVGRSTVKRGVMTYGYSSVAFGMAQQVSADFMEPIALKVLEGALARHSFGADDGKAAAGWLGKHIYKAVVAVLPHVAGAMEWLKATAGTLAHESLGVLLLTPMGFPMLMRETETTAKRVNILLLDRTVPVLKMGVDDRRVGDSVLKRVRVGLRAEEPTRVLKHKQQSGIAPQTVHAMDACHLQMTVEALQALDVTDVLLIHDSFAVHAAHVGTLSATLRSAFVGLYSAFDPLADILERAQAALTPETALRLRPVPDRGCLDLAGVLQADYAFS